MAQALQVAQAHLDHARFTEAEAVLMQILGVKPQAVRVHLALAQLRIRRQQRQEKLRNRTGCPRRTGTGRSH